MEYFGFSSSVVMLNYIITLNGSEKIEIFLLKNDILICYNIP